MKNLKNNNKAFSLIEVMVSIFVFTLWVMWVYAIIVSTMEINDYNKNYIIASNLAREQLELVRNIRDVNYKNIQNYNEINPNWSIWKTWTNLTDYYSSGSTFFQTWSYYKVENNFNSNNTVFPVKVEKISYSWIFPEWESQLSSMWIYQICLDSNNLYTYDCTAPNIKTVFYKYLYVDEVKYNSWWTDKVIDNSLKVTSKVIWDSRSYHETEISTVLADWKRL